MNLLEVKNLSVAFQQGDHLVEAVRAVSFDVHQGETLGIVGESGSGKTVTAMSIMRLLPKTAKISADCLKYNNGETEVDLLKIGEARLREIRLAQISIIFQEPMSSLNPVLRCGVQVAEGYLAHFKSTKKDARSLVEDIFLRLGLHDAARVYDSYPHELSGGQLQRVLIGLALVCKPKLVIADEPTTALDVTVQRKIIQLLIELKSEFNLTIIFISHDLGLVRNICDRVIVMQAGQIVEQNSVVQIFENASHPYTKGLIHSRAPLHEKWRELPTVDDFISSRRTMDYYNDDLNRIHPTELDRKIIEFDQQSPIIRVEDLVVSYPKTKNWYGRANSYFNAVDHVDFTMRQGEVLGIVGESGSGKSSLGKAILGLTPITSGKVFYKDKMLNELSYNQWKPLRKELQIIFQDPYSSLNPRQKIGASILEAMEVHKMWNNTASRRDKTIEWLEEVGLHADHYERYPHQFSGGQRQRICIARALALEPKFIVCDESVSALDVSVQAQVLNLLQKLKSKFKLSYLFISHDLSVINFIADRILVMQQGHIVEQGKAYEIINKPKEKYTQELIDSIFV